MEEIQPGAITISTQVTPAPVPTRSRDGITPSAQEQINHFYFTAGEARGRTWEHLSMPGNVYNQPWFV